MLLPSLYIFLGHNGIVHKPGESSSIAVAPAIGCSNCFTIYNYGQNYVRRYTAGQITEMDFPRAYLPVAAMIVNDTILASVDNNIQVKLIALTGKVETEITAGCPDPENLVKFIDIGLGVATALDLKTGTVFTVDVQERTCSVLETFPDQLDSAPLMYDGATFYGYGVQENLKCWFFGVEATGASISCFRNGTLVFESDRLNDGHPDPSNMHTGGDIFFAKGCLYATNGDTNPPALTDGRIQKLTHTAGKVLEWCDPETTPAATIRAVGLRHPWTTVQITASQRAVADVGQESVEDISVFDASSTALLNFGWPKFEGDAFRSAIAPYNQDSVDAKILVTDRVREKYAESYDFVWYLVIYIPVAAVAALLLVWQSAAAYQVWALLLVTVAGIPMSVAPYYRGFDYGVVATEIRTLLPFHQEFFAEWYLMTTVFLAALVFLIAGAAIGKRALVGLGAICLFVYITTFVAMISAPAVPTAAPFLLYGVLAASTVALVQPPAEYPKYIRVGSTAV